MLNINKGGFIELLKIGLKFNVLFIIILLFIEFIDVV